MRDLTEALPKPMLEVHGKPVLQHIVEGLRLELSPDEQVELAKPPTKDAAASEEYLRGRDCMGRFIYHTVVSIDDPELDEQVA